MTGELMTPDFSTAELWACVLEGELTAMGAGFVPVDLPVCPELRATTLSPFCASHATVERQSAAWVYGVTVLEPWPHTIAVDADHRLAILRTQELLIREVKIPTRHRQRLGEVMVTTPLRTAIDLARTVPWAPGGGHGGEAAAARSNEMQLRETLWRLIVLSAATIADIDAELDGIPNLPHKRRASARLLAAMPVDC